MRGHTWRVQDDGSRGRFDELVVIVGKPNAELIVHAEMMDNRSCFVDVAGICIWVHSGRDGVARVSHAEDRRKERRRDGAASLEYLRDPMLDRTDLRDRS